MVTEKSFLKPVNQVSAVSIATGYVLDGGDVGVRIPVEARFFFSPRNANRFWGPPSLLSNRYRGPFPQRIKQPEREADHSPPTSTEVKNTWIYTTPPAFLA
jgi:hypothetical protein